MSEISERADELITAYGNASYYIEELNEDNHHTVKNQLDSSDKSRKALSDYIAALEAEVEALRWIPVSEGLPESEDLVCVFCEGEINYGFYSDGILKLTLQDELVKVPTWIVGNKWYTQEDYSDITHWMPLPKPPLPTSNEAE